MSELQPGDFLPGELRSGDPVPGEPQPGDLVYEDGCPIPRMVGATLSFVNGAPVLTIPGKPPMVMTPVSGEAQAMVEATPVPVEINGVKYDTLETGKSYPVTIEPIGESDYDL